MYWALVLQLATSQPDMHLNRPSVAAAVAGLAADGLSTYWFLNNGSPCSEANPFLGPFPSGRRIAAMDVLTVGIVVGLQYAIIRGGRLKTRSEDRGMARILSRTVGYTAGALGATMAVRNVRNCRR